MTQMPPFENTEDHRTYKPGDVIFRKGDAPDAMYVVLDGIVAIGDEEDPIDRVGAGSIFGEMALVDDAPRSATARAETESKVVAISNDRFHALVEETPAFALQVMKIMAARLRRLMR